MNWLRSNWVHLVGVVVLTAYVGCVAVIYSLPALAADEIAYFIWTETLQSPDPGAGLTAPFYRLNLSGYGALYWTLYVNLIHFFGSQAVWAMRFLSLVALVSMPIAIAVVGNRTKRYLGWLLMALWLTMPVAWWCDKVTGPELFAMACIVHGVLLIHVQRMRSAKSETDGKRYIALLAWFALGMAIGLKLTMLPAVVFAFVVGFPTKNLTTHRDIGAVARYVTQALAPMIAAFVVCNPVVLLDSRAFFNQLQGLPSGTAWNWDVARLSLSNESWAWDGVFSGGLVQWSMAPGLFALLGIGLLATRRFGILTALTVSFVACWGMIVSKGALLGWYWFGWIPVIVLSCLWAFQTERFGRAIGVLLLLITVLNGSFQAGAIATRLRNKLEHVEALRALPDLQAAIATATRDQEYDLVLDYSEVAYDQGLEFPPSLASEIIQTSPPAAWKLSRNWQAITGLSEESMARAKRGILSNAFVAINGLSEHGTEGKSILLVVSKRLVSNLRFRDFETYFQNDVIPASPAGTTFKHLLNEEHADVYELKTNQQ